MLANLHRYMGWFVRERMNCIAVTIIPLPMFAQTIGWPAWNGLYFCALVILCASSVSVHINTCVMDTKLDSMGGALKKLKAIRELWICLKISCWTCLSGWVDDGRRYSGGGATWPPTLQSHIRISALSSRVIQSTVGFRWRWDVISRDA